MKQLYFLTIILLSTYLGAMDEDKQLKLQVIGASWSDVLGLKDDFEKSLQQNDRQNIIDAHIRFAFRVKIDAKHLTREQLRAIGKVEEKQDSWTFEEFGEAVTRIVPDLDKAIEEDRVGDDFTWRNHFGETPKDKTYSSPKTLKKERLAITKALLKK